VKRCKCCKQPVPEKPRKEVFTVEGISYTVNRWKDGGTTVETPCRCKGFQPSTHSTHDCPWMKQRYGPYPWLGPAV